MKDEEKAVRLFQGVTDVGDDLIEEAGAVRKRKKMTPWRWGLAAACLCLALLGTAGAVQFFGVRIVNGDDGFIRLQGGIAYRPYDSLSDEIKATEDELVTRPFDSWPEVEDFIGVELMDNPVLDASPAENYHSVWDNVHGRFLVSTSVGLYMVRASGCYEIGDVDINVECELFTDRMLALYEDHGETWDETFRGYRFPDGTALVQDAYTASNGLEAQIMEVDRPDGSRDTCLAAFSLNGIPFLVRAHSHNGMEEARAALIQVLNSFQA